MAIKALWKIYDGKEVHEPGTVIQLSAAEEKELIALGAAEKVIAAKKAEEQTK